MYRLVFVATLLAIANGAVFSVIDRHIIGGKETNIQAHPYMVSLQVRDKHICGGAILSSTHILTAAYCFIKYYPRPPTLQEYKVQVGATLLKNDGKKYGLAKYVSHPKLRADDVHYDVAVIKLETPIDFNANAKPLHLVPINQEPLANELVTASGWGATTKDVNPVDTLHSVSLPIMNRPDCITKHLCIFDCSRCRRMAVDHGLLCAGGNGFNVRSLDLGGPLVNSKKQIVGVSVYLHNCHPIDYPSIAINIADPIIHNFITANLK